MPSTQKVHIDTALTNISLGYMNEEFIADRIFKPVPVEKQSDRYWIFGKEHFRVNDDRRAPGTTANEIKWDFSHDTFFCEGHALRHFIPDEEMQNNDGDIDLEIEATELVSGGILLNKEIDCAKKITDSNNYDPALVFATGGSNPLKWSDPASDPVKNVEDAKTLIHKASGLRPNTLIISEPVFKALRIHPKLLGVFKNTEVSLVPLNFMREFFQVQDILIGSALKSAVVDYTNSDKDGLDYVYGNSAVLAHIPVRPSRKMHALGYSFMWNKDGAGSVQVRKFYKDDNRATVIEAERWYDQKMISTVAGALFPDVIA
jgi:hypothetical protein